MRLPGNFRFEPGTIFEPMPNMKLSTNHTTMKISTRGYAAPPSAVRPERYRIADRAAATTPADRRAETQTAWLRPSCRTPPLMRRSSEKSRRDASTRCAERAACRRHGEQNEKARGAEPARHRGTERQQPDAVDAEVHEVGVQKGIGDEGPDIRAKTAREMRRFAEMPDRSEPE